MINFNLHLEINCSIDWGSEKPVLATCSQPPQTILIETVAYAGFFNDGGSVTSHRDDVKMLHYNYSSLEVLKCIVL